MQLIRDEKVLSDSELVSTLNTFFTSAKADIPTLNSFLLPGYLHSHEDPPTIFSHQACKKLLNLNPNKSSGPDHIPARIVKEFALRVGLSEMQ